MQEPPTFRLLDCNILTMRRKLQDSDQGLMDVRLTNGQGAVATEDAVQDTAEETAIIAITAGCLLVVGAEVGARTITLLWKVLLGRSGRTEGDEEQGCDGGELHFG